MDSVVSHSFCHYNADVKKFLAQCAGLNYDPDMIFLRNLIQNSVDSLMRAKSEYGVPSIWVSQYCTVANYYLINALNAF